MKDAMFFRFTRNGCASAKRRFSAFSKIQLKMLVKVALLPVLVGACLAAYGQTNEWAWINGSGAAAAPGVYGTLGTPAAGNVPGARSGAAVWADKSGNFWLFGGYGYDAAGVERDLNDLWEFNPSTNEWAWMGGSSTVAGSCPSNQPLPACGPPGVYGTLGVPAARNIPGARDSAANWTDSSGNLWLFGGNAFDVNNNFGTLNDLWEFVPSTQQWAWMGGSNAFNLCSATMYFQIITCTVSGNIGQLGVPNVGLALGGRASSAHWTDSSGNFWLFGGYGFQSTTAPGIWPVVGDLNDLWEFNPSTLEWAWMGPCSFSLGNVQAGQPGCGENGVYGLLGTPATGNMPGQRDSSLLWTDRGGNLWLFGGHGYDSAGNSGDLNDLWEFNPSTFEWAWMGGSDLLACANGSCSPAPGVYGTLGVPAPGNFPGGRSGPAAWSDSSGNFWLFGGSGYADDLWVFSPSAGEWTWMGGSSATNQPGVYGTLGTPAAGNIPASRSSAASWSDSGGNLWLFGGAGPSGLLNDHWEYWPLAPPATAAPTFSPAAGTYPPGQTVTIGDATAGATIYYTTSGTTPTTSSTVYSGPVTVSTGETLAAIATAPGYTTSSVASAAYIIAPLAATPAFSVAAGTYTSAQTVSIADATTGAAIYYTTDGTTPTVASAVYSGVITVPVTETIQAMAMATGYSPSTVAEAAYTITPGFTIAGKALSVAPGASTGNTSTITVTSVGGFTGSVTLSAAVTLSPTGAQHPPTLSFGSTSPLSIAGSTAATATLTITTTAANSSALVYPNRSGGRWYAAGATALACMLLFGVPARRRRWRRVLGMMVLLASFAGGVLACGGGGGGGGTSNPGTTAGAYTVTVTATSGKITSTGTVGLTVQ